MSTPFHLQPAGWFAHFTPRPSISLWKALSTVTCNVEQIISNKIQGLRNYNMYMYVQTIKNVKMKNNAHKLLNVLFLQALVPTSLFCFVVLMSWQNLTEPCIMMNRQINITLSQDWSIIPYIIFCLVKTISILSEIGRAHVWTPVTL